MVFCYELNTTSNISNRNFCTLPLWRSRLWILYVHLHPSIPNSINSHFQDHFGVIRALVDADLLPRVVTGTSAGGLMAGMTCIYTDEELKVLLVPDLANKITACEESMSVWLRRLVTTGARFDSLA